MFIPPTGEASELATKTFLLSDVQKSTGIFPNRSSYTLKNISVQATYNLLPRSLRFLEQSICHINETLNLVISYSADKNKKDYSGTGSASLPNMTLNFTTRIVVSYGKAYYYFDRDSFTFNFSGLILPGPYIPYPPAADKDVFDDLVRKDLYNELNFIYNTTLAIWFSDIVREYKINWSYPNPYVYSSMGLACSYDLGISQVTLLGESNPYTSSAGIVFGSPGSITAANPFCSEIVPPNNVSAHYYSLTMVTQLLEETVKNAPDWSPLQLDEYNTKTPYFQFYVNELESIIPNAVARYPDFSERFRVFCFVESPSYKLAFDSQRQLINATLVWHCSLRHTSGEILAGVVTKLNYSAVINSTKVMHTYLKNVVLDSVEWREASGYPIAMKSLATLFLNSVLEGYVGLPTVGNNFLQPLLGKVNTVIHEEYIAIYQSSNIQAIQ